MTKITLIYFLASLMLTLEAGLLVYMIIVYFRMVRESRWGKITFKKSKS